VKFTPKSRKKRFAEISSVKLADKIEIRPVSSIKPYAQNAREHSDQQIVQIAASMTEFGFFCPVVTDQNGNLIIGHGRYEAARYLGLREIPVIQVSNLTPAQIRAFRLADNRLAELSKWNKNALKAEFEFLINQEFKIETTGFSTSQIDMLLESEMPAADDPLDEAQEPVGGPAVTKLGDVWALGKHRLICGSAIDPAVYLALLVDGLAALVFTDPPYNVPVDGHVCGLGKIKHREFAMAAGEMSEEQFIEFLSRCMALLCRYSASGSIHYICMDWRHLSELVAAARENYTEYKQLIVWNKDNGGMGAFYRSKHEMICVFKNGTAKHINNFGLGEGGRYRTNVWDYPGVNSLKRGRQQELEMHPTVKPVALVADAIRDCSNRGDIVLDVFMGSGTTLIAAERTGRVCRGCELDPLYVDVAVRRWQALTGQQAVLEGSGETFDAIAARQEVQA